MFASYTCGRCGQSVVKDARSCPHCGANLAGIKCKNCGYSGSESDFAGDMCPICRSSVRTGGRSDTPSMQVCKGCGRTIKSADWTCPHCGHTQWGMIAAMGLFAIVCIAVALVGAPQIADAFWRTVAMWGAGILGLICALVTISETVTGLKS